MQVQLFIPCYIDQLFPETGFNTIKLLELAGCKVIYNPEQTCCGQPAFNNGFVDETKQLAEKFIVDFKGADYIISPGCSCTGFIKNYYPGLFSTIAEKDTAKQLTSRMFDITDFLVNVADKTQFGSEFNAKVCMHDSCSALREYKIGNEPRILLSKVKGLELIELADTKTCCGFGGTFSVKHTAISTAMVQQKVEQALEIGAEYITSTEASCLMNIASYIQKQKLPIKAIHIVDILASNLR